MSTWLARRDAIAKLFAALLVTAAVVSTLDPVASLSVIGALLVLLPLTGVGLGTLWRRGWPILASAAGIFVFTVLFGARDSPVVAHLDWLGGLDVRQNAAGYALRLLAVGLPGFVVFATIDPTDLADSLVAHLRVSPRFAIGALAALRLAPLLADEYRLIRLARRARGTRAGVFSTLFGLLVAAIRRGIRLATAMEARGFDGGDSRTIARDTRFGWPDALVVAAGLALAMVVILLKFART
ncbi:energy-coupling factor transporter transmembrane component T family protein [Dactylosporangium sp. CA-233914]|uniref:energy-coupling factor transporter transmembrane component T family protein n=1 Tax=Dactylosporangium sp. CA-233914 TaxID=3239934 RepID=UPI003D906DD4